VGARLSVEGPIDELEMKEFFLLLSSTGLAYRRCRMVRRTANQVGVEFLKPAEAAGARTSPKRRRTTVPEPTRQPDRSRS